VAVGPRLRKLAGCVDLECGPAPVDVITDKAGTYRPACSPMLVL